MSAIFSAEEYRRRLEVAEDQLIRHRLDALVAYSVKNAPGPVAYLAGYEPQLGLHDVALLLLTPHNRIRRTLLTNAFWDSFDDFSWIDEVVLSSQFAEEMTTRLPRHTARIGIAGYRFFPAWILDRLKTTQPDAEFIDTTSLLQRVAQVKSDREIQVLRQVAGMTDAGGRAFLEKVSAGADERELRIAVENALLESGADGPSFGVQVYSGNQVAIGIGFATGRTLQAGDQVQLDCGAQFCGYRGDLSRVTTIGTPQPEVERTMETTARMYESMLASITPGRPIADVAHAALEVARNQGLEDAVYHSVNHPIGFVGHGIGCWVHEFPEIRPDADGLLQVGMVIVLEPILVRPGIGGAKIEDAVVVGTGGAERLSSLDVRTWPM